MLRIQQMALVFALGACLLPRANGQTAYTAPYPPGKFIKSLYKPKEMVFRNDTVSITPRWFVPDHYRLQYAGNIGFMSIGAGYQVRGRYEPTLYVGVLSKPLGGSTCSVTTVSLKNGFKINKQPLMGHLYAKAGLSVNWGYTNNTFNKLPPHYPGKYYFQNKVHLAPFAGAEFVLPIRDKNLKAIGLYGECASLDAYVLEYVRTRYVGLDDIVNFAIGISFYLH